MDEANKEKEVKRGLPKVREGVVVSDKMNKTIVVSTVRLMRHPGFKKYVRVTKRFHVHDEREQANVGDTVRIVETRPLSKTKRWRLTEVLKKAD
ncbi:MAG: 30S ribosomal protein S17 [Bdellovibrionales bacterium]|nr:30S ribosomal protein S17 [Bdellovibrionales bacterium]